MPRRVDASCHPVEEAVHGGIDLSELSELRISPDDVIDFSSNINPFGSSPGVAQALRGLSVDRLPDRNSTAIRERLGELHDLAPERILVGNGTSEILWLLALAFLGRGNNVLIAGPTYSEYSRCAMLAGACPFFAQATRTHDFRFPCNAWIEGLAKRQPRMCFLANPNNPTGALVSVDQVLRWTEAFPETIFVVDEAYIEFAEEDLKSLVPNDRPNLVVLRSLTKAYALAGLRLGYAVAETRLIDRLRRVRPPWTVNLAAQHAGLAALHDQRHLDQSIRAIRELKADLVAKIRRTGLAPVPSGTPFFMIPVVDGARVRANLLKKKILVRDCASFGLPEFIRVSTGRAEVNQLLVAALQRVDRE